MSINLASDGRSGELDYNCATIIEEGATLKPLHDQIIVEPMPVEHSDILEVIEHTKPLRGIVKAVGPGHYPMLYDHPDKHKRTKMWRSKRFQPTQVKVGDLVELGSPQGARGYNFQQFLWGTKLHITCREADVTCIVLPEDAA